MNGVDPNLNIKRRRNNWIVLVALLALAAFLYGFIIMKAMRFGLPAPP